MIDAALVEAVTQGRTIAMPENAGPPEAEGGLVALLDRDSRLIALAEPDALGQISSATKSPDFLRWLRSLANHGASGCVHAD